MTEKSHVQENPFAQEDFAALFEEYEKDSQKLVEGTVVKGVIVGITDQGVSIDIGAKSVGFIDSAEFKRDGEIAEGDVVDVFLERLENKRGELIISRDNARRYINWFFLKNCLEDKTTIEGTIIGKVKGGFAVDVNGITCFLPRSQVDTMLLTDDTFLINKVEKLQVLKIDDVRGNVVVSRRAILETQRNVEKDKVLATIKVGDALDGVVKNITDYGAFVDFGSFDGLLHLTDISWCRVRHPSEALKVGQEVKVQVIKFDAETKRVSLGMKQLQQNPWESIAQRYPVGATMKGKVTNMTTYGAFVEIEPGIEGLVHVSEMSWLKNNSTPNKFIASGQEVEVMVLDINSQNHRISLGMKQCEKNPWQAFSEAHQVGDVVEGVVKNFTEFGLFIGFDSGVDGLIHVSDISAEGAAEEVLKKFKKDEKIKVMVLGSNYEKERISLGIRQLTSTTFKDDLNKLDTGSIVSCVIINVKKDFLEVELDSGLKAIIKRLDLSNSKSDQKTEKYEVGDRIEAKVTLFNKVSGKLLLSIKDMESDEQEAHIYTPADTGGNTLASISGEFLESLAAAQKENNKE
ncbi:MAG: 30S ribosomal protein S1 [Rickettsiales bacterium]|nr:30S ribosomal protein S1 [Rickettsiales bacterium]